MTKIEISYKKRLAAIIVLIILAVAAASTLIVFGIIGIHVNKSVQTASYNTKSEIKYNLNFIDDPLYNNTNLVFGEGYVAKLVNNMDLTFLYGFSGGNATDISGNYTATALLEATYNEKNLIWKKEYPLVPQTNFNTGNAPESVSLPLREYIDFTKTLQQDTGVTTYVKMTVTYTVNASAVIDGKLITETSESTLIIPITGDVIVMGGNPVNEQSKTIESAVSQELLPKKEMLIVSSVLLALLVGALFCLLMLTSGVRVDPIKLQMNKIFKKYNSRIVELHSDNLITDCETVSLKSFNDLLLTADEMRKPIFTNSRSNYIDTEFYVFDDPKKYAFKMSFLKDLYDEKDEDVYTTS